MGLKSYMDDYGVEVGLDEAGRGAFSGPIVVAAAILPKKFDNELIRDSKKLTEKKREEAFEIIKDVAFDYSISIIKPSVVDMFNVLNATMHGMKDCILQLKCKVDHIIVDGNYFCGIDGIKHTCVVGGDNEYYSIAAASILAKVTRDRYMRTLHEMYPMYGWDKNKGYGTKQHRGAILEHGSCEYHRKTFLNKLRKGSDLDII